MVRQADHRAQTVFSTRPAHPSRRKEMDSPAPVWRVSGRAGKQAALGNVRSLQAPPCLGLPPGGWGWGARLCSY